MSFFSKKSLEIGNPVSGEVIDLENVPDPLFSSKTMGNGFAVKPEENQIYAPFAGKILSVFPTKHAITMLSKSGIECLLHIGIDTVELNGAGFSINLLEGQKISKGDLLGTVDFDFVKSKGKDTDVICIFTNLGDKELHTTFGYHTKNEIISKLN